MSQFETEFINLNKLKAENIDTPLSLYVKYIKPTKNNAALYKVIAIKQGQKTSGM